jgi:hypothetical protein
MLVAFYGARTVPNEDLPGLRIGDGVYARAHALVRELNLPADTTRSQLITALARSRVIAPSLPVAFDDTQDLEDVLRVIPHEELRVQPAVSWRAVVPTLAAREPRYTIHVRAVMCADSDGSHAANISEAKIGEALKAWSQLYYRAGLTFVLSQRVVLHDTMINQDFTVPPGLDFTNPAAPMTNDEVNKSNDKHDAARSAWARNYPGELVVFFRRGTKLRWSETAQTWYVDSAGNAYSGSQHEFVAMPQNDPPEAVLLAHESGHYFHLAHTHGDFVILKTAAEKALYADWKTNLEHRQEAANLLRSRLVEAIRSYVDDQSHSPESGLDVLDYDKFADTLPDPGPPIFAYEFGDACAAPGGITVQVNLTSGPRTYNVTGAQDNIMSYFFRCSGVKRFSEMQIDRIRHSLETPVFTGSMTTQGGNTLPILSRHHLIAPVTARQPWWTATTWQRLRNVLGVGGRSRGN